MFATLARLRNLALPPRVTIVERRQVRPMSAAAPGWWATCCRARCNSGVCWRGRRRSRWCRTVWRPVTPCARSPTVRRCFASAGPRRVPAARSAARTARLLGLADQRRLQVVTALPLPDDLVRALTARGVRVWRHQFGCPGPGRAAARRQTTGPGFGSRRGRTRAAGGLPFVGPIPVPGSRPRRRRRHTNHLLGAPARGLGNARSGRSDARCPCAGRASRSGSGFWVSARVRTSPRSPRPWCRQRWPASPRSSPAPAPRCRPHQCPATGGCPAFRPRYASRPPVPDRPGQRLPTTKEAVTVAIATVTAHGSRAGRARDISFLSNVRSVAGTRETVDLGDLVAGELDPGTGGVAHDALGVGRLRDHDEPCATCQATIT